MSERSEQSSYLGMTKKLSFACDRDKDQNHESISTKLHKQVLWHTKSVEIGKGESRENRFKLVAI